MRNQTNVLSPIPWIIQTCLFVPNLQHFEKLRCYMYFSSIFFIFLIPFIRRIRSFPFPFYYIFPIFVVYVDFHYHIRDFEISRKLQFPSKNSPSIWVDWFVPLYLEKFSSKFFPNLPNSQEYFFSKNMWKISKCHIFGQIPGWVLK